MKGLERPECSENLATKNRSFAQAYILPVSDFCQSEIKYGVHWPRTKTGEEVTVECSLVDSNLTGIVATCIIDLCHFTAGVILVGVYFSLALSPPIL